MAGTLLLIRKSNTPESDFEQKKAQMQQKVKETFSPFYPAIHFAEPDKNSFLVEFRKDDEKKFAKNKEGSWLTYEGTVFALNETKALSAEELLNIYFSNKKEFANLLDGHFVIKLFDATVGKHIVISDFTANKTNFLCQTKKYVMFTPFAVTTAVIKKPELDQDAFNEFMWRYYMLSNKSLLKDVSRLQPASEYAVLNQNVTESSYFNWPQQYTDLSFNEAVEKTTSSLKETARLIKSKFENVCIDFTMGQDSRTVLSAFTNQKLKFSTSTYGKPDFNEVREVKKSAEALNFSFTNIVLESDYTNALYKHFKKSVLHSSCEEPGYQIGRIMYMRQKQQPLGDVLVNGMEGRFYKNGLWDEMYTFNFYREPKSFNTPLFLKLRPLSKNYKDTIFTDDFLQIKQRSRDYFTNMIDETIKNDKSAPVSVQVQHFDVFHWLNFAKVANNASNLIHNSISPLLLRRNLEFALQIPAKWKFNLSKYQRAIVYGLDPRLARLKSDFAGINMVPKNIFTAVPFYFRYYYFQSTKLRKKILTKFGFNVVNHLQEAWDYLPLYNNLYNDPEFQQNLEYETLELKNIIVKTEWEKFLQKYATPEELSLNDFEYLFKLVSVEVFLKEVKSWGR